MKGSFNNIRLAGVATAVPTNEVNNEDLADVIGEKAIKKQIKATGIKRRRVLSPDQCGVDLCLSGAIKLIQALNWKIEDVKLIVYSSVYSLYAIPSTAYYIQKMLGAPMDCLAYDLKMACSGYVNGIINIGSLMQHFEPGDKALLFTACEAAEGAGSGDRGTVSLFGDGASVSAFEIAKEQTMHFSSYSDGNRIQYLMRKTNDSPLFMDGIEVFKFAISDVADSVNEFFETFCINPNEIDMNLIHQAQKYIIEKMADFCPIDLEKTPITCENYGNTSATSIPLTMCCLRDQVDWTSHKKLFLCGYGAGLAWANIYMETNNVTVLPIIETNKVWER